MLDNQVQYGGNIDEVCELVNGVELVLRVDDSFNTYLLKPGKSYQDWAMDSWFSIHSATCVSHQVQQPFSFLQSISLLDMYGTGVQHYY